MDTHITHDRSTYEVQNHHNQHLPKKNRNRNILSEGKMRSEHRNNSENTILNKRTQRVFQSESPVKDNKYHNISSSQQETNCNSTKNQSRFLNNNDNQDRFPAIYNNKPYTANNVKTSNEKLNKISNCSYLKEK